MAFRLETVQQQRDRVQIELDRANAELMNTRAKLQSGTGTEDLLRGLMRSGTEHTLTKGGFGCLGGMSSTKGRLPAQLTVASPGPVARKNSQPGCGYRNGMSQANATVKHPQHERKDSVFTAGPACTLGRASGRKSSCVSPASAAATNRKRSTTTMQRPKRRRDENANLNVGVVPRAEGGPEEFVLEDESVIVSPGDEKRPAPRDTIQRTTNFE